jgi:hypothetical protein
MSRDVRTRLPGSQVLRFVIPKYVQGDLSLARVFDERHADVLGRRLRGARVRDLLPPAPVDLPSLPMTRQPSR